MWLSRTMRRQAFFGAIFGTMTLLAGCSSFTPVYSGALAAMPSLGLSYAKPNSRLEQVIYQELSLRLGSSDEVTAPLASLLVNYGAADMMLSRTDNPSKPVEATVTASLTITPRDNSGTAAKTFTRTATANYTRNDQVLADRAALDEALERAAKAVAESLRLAVLADLSR